MSPLIKPLVYLAAGLILLALYGSRKQSYERLRPELLPQLSPAEFGALQRTMYQSVERMLLLALAFIFLSAVIFAGWHDDFRLFAVLVVAVTFVLNIGPRHRLGKIVFNAGIDPADLKQHGIRL